MQIVSNMLDTAEETNTFNKSRISIKLCNRMHSKHAALRCPVFRSINPKLCENAYSVLNNKSCSDWLPKIWIIPHTLQEILMSFKKKSNVTIRITLFFVWKKEVKTFPSNIQGNSNYNNTSPSFLIFVSFLDNTSPWINIKFRSMDLSQRSELS